MTARRRVYERAVLRPFAEQLIDAAGIQPGERVAELLPRSDMVALVLASIAPGAAALPVRDESDLRRIDAAAAIAAFTVTASTAALARAAAAGMRVSLLSWSPHGPPATTGAPPLEEIVASTYADIVGLVPAALTDALSAPALDGWLSMPITDVCRFDSAAELVASVCAWHGIDVDASLLEALSSRVAVTLADRTGFDGTLRVPVTALLLQSG